MADQTDALFTAAVTAAVDRALTPTEARRAGLAAVEQAAHERGVRDGRQAAEFRLADDAAAYRTIRDQIVAPLIDEGWDDDVSEDAIVVRWAQHMAEKHPNCTGPYCDEIEEAGRHGSSHAPDAARCPACESSDPAVRGWVDGYPCLDPDSFHRPPTTTGPATA